MMERQQLVGTGVLLNLLGFETWWIRDVMVEWKEVSEVVENGNEDL